jgi:diguanylate cyclase (GGDEF)-like protein/PAS domain S-box-containing protein
MKPRTLHARFLRAVLSVGAALLAVSSVVVFLTARERFVTAESQSVRAMVSAVDKTLAVGAYARDQVLLQELLDGLARNPSVLGVEIRDAAGLTLLKAGGEPTKNLLSAGLPEVETPLVSPFDASETLGRLRLWLDRERLQAEAGRQAATLVLAMLVVAVCMLVIFDALARRILSRPMHRLADELGRVVPGKATRVHEDPLHDADEVGTVAKAANRLLELQESALAREREMREAIAAMEERYRGIFEASSAGIFVLSPEGLLTQANAALWRLINRAPGCDVAFVQPPFAEPEALRALIDRTIASQQSEAADLELVHADGRSEWVHCMLTSTRHPTTGEQQVEGVLYDVTRRHTQERDARYQAEHDALTGLKNRSHIEALLDTRVDTARERDGAVTLMFIDLDGFKAVNDQWGHAAGDAVLIEAAKRLSDLFRRQGEVVGRLGGDELVVLLDGVHATDPSVGSLAARLIENLKQPIALPNGELARIGASVGLASYPLHATTAQTLIYAADAAMYAVKKAGKGRYVIAATHDPAAQPCADPASAPGSTDSLTGLSDRRELLERLARLAKAPAASDNVAAIICMDIVQFKTVNLAYSPQAGDEVLREVARRLQRGLRQQDMVARIGSDEFAVLITTETGDEAVAEATVRSVIAKLRAALNADMSVAQRQMRIDFSMGIRLISARTDDTADALREAQLALRLAKKRQAGSELFFQPEMMDGYLQQRSLEDDLRLAAEAGQLRLFVQPQKNRKGQICGGEALLRWQHPTRGLVPPGEFIPLAESSGCIGPIGQWVLQEGCKTLARMNAGGQRYSLAVNISPLQFNHPDFVAQVQAALQSTGASPEALVLEITEGLLLSDMALVSAKMTQLAAAGVRFSIDDFGTGFSSLSYLRQLPLHEIKIDGSFVAGLPDDAASAGIVRSILSMGRHLGLKVVAEGVETSAQADFLSAHSCETQQGWLHGRPAPAAEFIAHLEQPMPATKAQPATARPQRPLRPQTNDNPTVY